MAPEPIKSGLSIAPCPPGRGKSKRPDRARVDMYNHSHKIEADSVLSDEKIVIPAVARVFRHPPLVGRGGALNVPSR